MLIQMEEVVGGNNTTSKIIKKNPTPKSYEINVWS